MSSTFEAVIVPQTRNLGDGFEVRRVLPSPQRRTVGPFVFFDQMGPIVLRLGTGSRCSPASAYRPRHRDYLFDGEILHRDSLGTVQPIRPGEVNWMTSSMELARRSPFSRIRCTATRRQQPAAARGSERI